MRKHAYVALLLCALMLSARADSTPASTPSQKKAVKAAPAVQPAFTEDTGFSSTTTQTSNASRQGFLDPLKLPDCADVSIGPRQMDLAQRADIVLTGITLAAGPGAGRCETNGSALNIALDNSTDPSTNFIVMGIQCVHKGLVSCRSNAEDTKDCLILIAAPSMKDAAPCSLAQGERYQVYLQKQTNGCGGYYLTMYERIYHSVRRPLGGTGCTFYPSYPDPQDLQVQLNSSCAQPVTCKQDACSPLISKSPCANDTSVTCSLKTCPGKYMYQNAIMPEDTCFELYNYATSGMPTNCYGRRYINNRIRELAKNGNLFSNVTLNDTATNSSAAEPGAGGIPSNAGVLGDVANRQIVHADDATNPATGDVAAAADNMAVQGSSSKADPEAPLGKLQKIADTLIN